MGISSYSTTPGSNTSINGINIAEGWPAANINNAIRQLMADVASGSVIRQVPATTGSANAYVVTLSPAPTTLTGLLFFAVANFTNTGAATVNVNGLGAKNIYKSGTSGPTALSGSEITANNLIALAYDGTQFQLISSPSDLSAYLTAATAASTYATISSLGSYLTAATAASTYAPLASPALTGSPTAPTQSAGDNSTKLATTAYADSAKLGGAGTGWHDVSASRSFNTSYTNSTGRPISVAITFNQTAGGVTAALVDGVKVFQAQPSSIGEQGCFSFIVPNGLTYQITATSTKALWTELY